MPSGLLAGIVLSLIIAASDASAEGVGDIAPNGSLRVAIGVGPAPSPFWATRDPATGKLRGVTVELAKAAADNLGVPLQLVEFPRVWTHKSVGTNVVA